MRTIAIAGSTGSIGTQTLDVVAAEPDRYEVVALGATGRNLDLLAEQVQAVRPRVVAIADEAHVAAAAERLPVTMPQLVIVSALMNPAELEIVTDRCVAVGAEILPLDPATPANVTAALVRTAARNALIKALAGS